MTTCEAAPSAQALAAANRPLAYYFAHRLARLARARNVDLVDLIGEGMVALCRAAREFRPDAGATFCTFASLVIRNAMWNVLNRRGGRAPTQLPVGEEGREMDVPDHRHDPEAGTGLDLAAVLGALPARDREVLTLRYWQGWTMAQMGAHLGVSTERARQLLIRALLRAREQAGQGEAARCSR